MATGRVWKCDRCSHSTEILPIQPHMDSAFVLPPDGWSITSVAGTDIASVNEAIHLCVGCTKLFTDHFMKGREG